MKKFYSCFNCPSENKDKETDLNDICPVCGEKYGFPLESYPKDINEYEVIQPLKRGFYSAIFKVREHKFKDRYRVLKVTPKNLYVFFNKNFENECQLHSSIASESEHIINIITYFDTTITFGLRSIECHVAVLEYIEGNTIEEILENNISLKADTLTQISIDLFRILAQLKQKLKRHNDLHEGNVIIQILKEDEYRLDAIDPTIRAKAIDINSAKGCRELYLEDRPRDIQCVARIIRKLCNKFFINPDLTNDLCFRAASKLLEISFVIDTKEHDYRTPNFIEIIETIKTEFEESQHGLQPWNQEFKLRHISDFYNAQALEPWFVSSLFVDPDNTWLSSISSPGPQLITGMRGCGKTILLKSLQFHARAVRLLNETKSSVINRLEKDGYIGLYVSSSRLINSKDVDPFSILFIGYIKSAIQAIKHLSDIDNSLINKSYIKNFVNLIIELIPNTQHIKSAITDSLLNLELEKIQNSLQRNETKFEIVNNPVFAFETLAKVVKKSAFIWNNHHVFFLLDDVSTRYIESELINKLISQLLIQNESFSFKITSEEHIIGYLLYSPGNIEKARPGRDYNLFDFGKEVKETIHGRYSKHRKEFVENILKKRLSYHSIYSNRTCYFPRHLLGNISLKEIAKSIATVRKTSPDRKRVYHGYSALTSICVGDIGDIINLYDKFLKSSKDEKTLSPGEQTKVYLDFCSHRLYDLNRIKPEMKKYALGFAEASHELLVESVKKDPSFRRIRQYNSIYINISSHNELIQNKMLEKINQMIDSGLFVTSGLAFRSKQHHTNPLLQFTLTFRKMFGLSNYIGLTESDRFELTGNNLKDWLENPAKCKTILKKNLSSQLTIEDDSDIEDYNDLEITPDDSVNKTNKPEAISVQKTLFDKEEIKLDFDLFKFTLPKIDIINKPQFLPESGINDLIIGLGFEERALESIRRYKKYINPKRIILIKYQDPGKSKQIVKLLKNSFPNSTFVEQIYSEIIETPILKNSSILLDVSGLSKAIIFNITRNALLNNNPIKIIHTEADSYYPTDKEIEEVFEAHKNKNHYEFLYFLNKILGGEKPPFDIINLLNTEVDESRNRVLLAFSKPKNERLYHILDNREYDRIELITPLRNTSSRSRVARMTADLVGKKYNNTIINDFDSNDLVGFLKFLTEKYQEYYVDLNYNIEIALTGSKRQTIAVAILSAICKFSKVWYIKPSAIDPRRFSKGVGVTNYIKIENKPVY